MASDATERQIENRRWVFFATAIIFLVVVIIILAFAIAKNFETPAVHDSEYAAASVAQGDQERADFPIIKYLPIQNSLFTIGYQLDVEAHKFTIKIKTTIANFDTAIKKLTSFDEDLTSYNLEITRPDNPFVSAYVVNKSTDVTKALKQGYAKIDNFQVQKTQLVEAENQSDEETTSTHYAIAVISTGRSDHYSLCTYRVVLKFENQQWLPVANPSPILNIYNMPGVPQDVLRQANNL